MNKYYDINDLPAGQIEFKLRDRSLPAYKLFFNDGYDEILIQFPGDPPVAFSKRFEELVARHGNPIDFRSLKVVDNDTIRREYRENAENRD